MDDENVSTLYKHTKQENKTPTHTSEIIKTVSLAYSELIWPVRTVMLKAVSTNYTQQPR